MKKSNNLQELFEYFLYKKIQSKPQDRFLLAVSGGKDSMALAHLFAQTSLTWGIAHVNFGLRGEAANEDALFVKKWAEHWQVPFFETQVETQHTAQQNKISIQMAARQLRYDWLAEIAQQHTFDWIVTAHHQNDHLETILLNLTKGTGMDGLRGIVPRRGQIIRPLSEVSQKIISAYISENQIVWQEDASNASDKYQRNLLRHQVVPVLEKINPSLTDTLVQTTQRLEAVADCWQDYLGFLKEKYWTEKNKNYWINAQTFVALPHAEVILWEWLKDWGFSWEQCVEICRQQAQQTGKMYLSDSHCLVRDRQSWVLTPRQGSAPLGIWIEADAERFTWEENYFEQKFSDNFSPNLHITHESSQVSIDADRLRYPLLLRLAQPGDAFVPLGMQGRKKVADFLKDEKVPRNIKAQTLVLLSDNEIVWVVGHRLDARFRVQADTQRICQIEQINP
jgi:tRNA(Ile)-lysidine synthase